MATHSSILALKIPWTEEPDGLQSMGLKRVDLTEQALRHTNVHVCACTHTHTHTHTQTCREAKFLLTYLILSEYTYFIILMNNEILQLALNVVKKISHSRFAISTFACFHFLIALGQGNRKTHGPFSYNDTLYLFIFF